MAGPDCRSAKAASKDTVIAPVLHERWGNAPSASGGLSGRSRPSFPMVAFEVEGA